MVEGTRPRRPEESVEHLKLCLDAIELNAGAYHEGKTAGWLAVSSQLYVLFCDRSRGATLTERTIPDLRLHPVRVDDPLKKEVGYLLYIPRMSIGPGATQFELIDEDSEKISVDDWLQQTIAVLNIKEQGKDVGVYITLNDIVREARNQAGGGHFDPEIRRVLQATYGMRIVEKGEDRPFHEKYLVTIGEYVVDEIRQYLSSH